MAYCNPYSSWAPPHPNFAHTSGYPVSTCGPGISHAWASCDSNVTAIVDLSAQIVALETQVETVRAEKVQAETIIQYLLRELLREHMAKVSQKTRIRPANTKLYAQLVRMKQDKQTLKVKLRLALQLLANHSVHKGGNNNTNSSVAANCMKKSCATDHQIAEDLLVDFLTSSPSTPHDISETNTVLSIDLTAKEEPDTSDYLSEDDGPQQKKLTSYSPVELAQTPYVYRFGHGNSSHAPTVDPDEESETNIRCEIDQKVSELTFGKPMPGQASECKESPLIKEMSFHDLSDAHDNHEKKSNDLAVVSCGTSFSSASTIATPDGDQHPNTSWPISVHPLEPNWSTPKIFSCNAERNRAVEVNRRAAGPQDLRFPDLFRHGIHFNPDPSERDIYRTALVSGIPVTATMNALLSQVRGGLVVSANLLDTVNITGSQTALIAFRHEHEASAFEDHARNWPIFFGNKSTRVELVRTPTWPIALNLRKAIDVHQHTRCLEVRKFPRQITPEALRSDLRSYESMKANAIEYMKMRSDGVLELQFSSIYQAGRAFGVLTCFRAYRQCSTTFAPDPCAQTSRALADDRKYGVQMPLKNAFETDQTEHIVMGSGIGPTATGKLIGTHCDDGQDELFPVATRGRGFRSAF